MFEFDFAKQPGTKLTNENANKTATPLLSIITPFYNGGTYFMQTVNCVLNQTFPFFEWIIVDDGSTDASSLALLEEVKQMDPRISVYHKENGGASSARNYAIQKSTTDLILPLDNDDLLEPTFVEYCYWMLYFNPDAAWSYTDSVGFQGEEYLWDATYNPARIKIENQLTQCALIRKNALLKVGCLDEKEKYYNEDWHLWLKLIAAGCFPAQSHGDYLMWYRRSNSGALSVVRKDKKLSKKNFKYIKEAASDIHDPKPPVVYPIINTDQWGTPKLSDFDKCVYASKEKTHVAFMFPHLALGGADKFNIDLMAGLANRGYELSVFTTVIDENVWQQNFREITPNIFNLPNFMSLSDFAEFVSYYIKSRKVDILFISNAYLGYYLSPWLRMHFPKLVIIDYIHMEEWYWRRGGYSRISAAISEVLEHTYVCNDVSRDILIDHFNVSPEKIDTVHIGVDSDYFDPEKLSGGTLRNEAHISEDRPIVLFICRLHEQKRPFLMLDIAQRVAKQLPEVAFAVVGDGPLEKDLRYEVSRRHLKKNVYFLGARSDTRPYYKDADLTLICSIKEGLALTAYESCAMGTPVVSADVGGQRDLIDNSVGALIPCLQREEDIAITTYSDEEIAAYVNAIVGLLNDKDALAKRSKCCREKILNGFRIDDMIDHFDIDFTRLMSDKELSEKRIKVSKELSSFPKLCEELITVSFQEENEENVLNDHDGETLIQKASRIINEEGFSGFVKRARKKIRYKIAVLLKRPMA